MESRGTGNLNWIVRASFSTGLADELLRAVAEIDRRQRVRRFRSLDQVVASTTVDSRLNAWLFGVFAGVALALTAIGVYGLLSYSMAHRRQEIGTRYSARSEPRGCIETGVKI